MADEVKEKEDTNHATFDNAPGGRNRGEIAKPTGGDVDNSTKDPPDYMPEGFSKRDVENMGGSLKVHVRLALKADIRIIAKIRGDICIGIL